MKKREERKSIRKNVRDELEGDDTDTASLGKPLNQRLTGDR